MTLAVDASVVVKWVLSEVGSDEARALIGAERLLAPDFLLLELANVLARQVRRGVISAAESTAGLATIADAGVRLLASAPHVREAHRLALALGASAYDCLYLAVALAEGVPLLTADARFAGAAGADPALAPAVRLL